MALVRLLPAFKDYLWGGTKLKENYNKKTDLDIVAESWELSTHKDGQSIVDSGEYKGLTLSEYVEKLGKDALGTKGNAFEFFPILIKFIDAKGNLSIQVHPDNEYALRVEKEYGKTEMWYILDAEEGASLYHFQLTDCALLNQLFCFGKHRHVKNRHCLHQNQLLLLCQCHCFLQLSVVYCDCLFAKYMLAMLQSAHHIVIMIGMRCCDINDIHLLICKQTFNIITVLNRICACKCRYLLHMTSSDGINRTMLLHQRLGHLHGNCTLTKNTPVPFFHILIPFLFTF